MVQECPGRTGVPKREEVFRLQGRRKNSAGEPFESSLEGWTGSGCGDGKELGRISQTEERAGAKAQEWGWEVSASYSGGTSSEEENREATQGIVRRDND